MMHAYHGPLTSRDDNGYTLLHQAVFSYDLDAIQTLLSRGAALNARGEVDGVTPLHLAVEHDQYTVAKILIDAGAQITLRESVNGYTPLHDTAYGNHVAIAKDLLLPRLTILQINARDPEFGKTPLHLAVSRKNYDMVALLMQHGADPYLKTKQQVSVTFRRIFPAQDAFALAKNDQRLLAMLRGKA
jgi:ankyrin repeat protein